METIAREPALGVCFIRTGVYFSFRFLFLFFFFQAEDGIRDYKVTGVQTCALPIYEDGISGGGRVPQVPYSLRREPLLGDCHRPQDRRYRAGGGAGGSRSRSVGRPEIP